MSRPRLLLLLPGWIAFMIYLPALGNGFVWDDSYFLTDLPFLRDPQLWWRQISEPLLVSQNYFRPLPLLSFVAEAWLSGLNPFVFHFDNLLLHAVNTTLVSLLARNLVEGRHAAYIAAAAGLLFGLHPALVESVCWVSDRFDLMMAGFLLAALLADARIARPLPRALTVGGLFLMAMLCKETAVVFVALLPLWRLAHQAPQRMAGGGKSARVSQAESVRLRGGPGYAVFVIVLLSYLAMRWAALGGLFHGDAQMQPGNALQHLLLTGRTFGWYVWLLFWPFGNIGPVHPAATPLAVNDAWAWLGVAAALLAVAGALWTLRLAPRSGWLILAALLALAPVSNLMPLTIGDNIAHDRYLLLPVALLSLALAAGWPVWTIDTFRRRYASVVAATIWAGLCVSAILLAVPRWESDVSLWRWAYAMEPGSKVATENVLAALANSGQDEEVLRIGGAALRDRPQDAAILQDMSLALMHRGRLAEAEGYSRKAVALFGDEDAKSRLDRSEAWNLLGYLEMKQGRLDDGRQALQEAIQLTPYLMRPHFNLAMVDYELGLESEAEAELRLVARYDSPRMAALHARLASEKKAELARHRAVR